MTKTIKNSFFLLWNAVNILTSSAGICMHTTKLLTNYKEETWENELHRVSFKNICTLLKYQRWLIVKTHMFRNFKIENTRKFQPSLDLSRWMFRRSKSLMQMNMLAALLESKQTIFWKLPGKWCCSAINAFHLEYCLKHRYSGTSEYQRCLIIVPLNK